MTSSVLYRENESLSSVFSPFVIWYLCLYNNVLMFFVFYRNGFQKLEKIKDANRQSRQLEELTDKMRDCKRYTFIESGVWLSNDDDDDALFFFFAALLKISIGKSKAWKAVMMPALTGCWTIDDNLWLRNSTHMLLLRRSRSHFC